MYLVYLYLRALSKKRLHVKQQLHMQATKPFIAFIVYAMIISLNTPLRLIYIVYDVGICTRFTRRNGFIDINNSDTADGIFKN